ncbi:hypothetical protein ACFE04_004829 [Oxalis oulophora]
MGCIGKLTVCFTGQQKNATSADEPLDDDGLGHSFVYIRPDPTQTNESTTTTFRTISGASVSANTSTPLSTSILSDSYNNIFDKAAAFESSNSFASIPLQPVPRGCMSGPIDSAGFMSGPIERGIFSGPIDFGFGGEPREGSFIRTLRKAVSKTMVMLNNSNYTTSTISTSTVAPINNKTSTSSKNDSLDDDFDDELSLNHLQWAQGKAGEDRLHVVVSEEHGWVFVGIYDGFNGPDAPDFLASNLYSAVNKELKKKGLLFTHHGDILEALSNALEKTEEAYLDIADQMLAHNPELSLMGSCVLVMLMKGDDVYVMNVGDSRAVIGQKLESDHWIGKGKQDLQRISEETLHDFQGCNGDRPKCLNILNAFQLSSDHCTSVKEEVQRIRNEHPDDASAVMNDRVKGSLKVTRAFGAGFLKQPKWNKALLGMFRIDYVGNSPYISCLPSLCHHKLGPKDKFLILSSDGLYQYFTNEEAVSEVELFISLQPEGDPAQHLVEESLFRAAKKAGIDFHELLEIPQGDRRRYHDDISVIVISLEGSIWKSCV